MDSWDEEWIDDVAGSLEDGGEVSNGITLTDSCSAIVMAFIIGFLLMVIFLVVASADEEAIYITPPMWMERKFLKWDGSEYRYLVEGWWFEEDDEGYYHVGDWTEFEVTKDVFWNDVLVMDPYGRMTKRLCKLGFVDTFEIASLAACVNGTQVSIPHVEGNMPRP